MKKPLRVLVLFGTRPEAIKLAPVIHECKRRSDEIETIVCSTGQHQELLQQVLDYFEITPDVSLDVMRENQSLAGLLSRCCERIDEAVQHHQPDVVVAQGDTTSVMAASLVAFFRKIPFLHVEAGLRTGNIHSPWPEELNRRVASLVTTIHCAPTQRSRQNLLDEGIAEDSVHVTGNTVVDSLLMAVERERNNGSHWKAKHNGLSDSRFVLITGHRRENFGEGFQNICQAIQKLSDRFSDVDFVYPVHLNPNVQKPVQDMLSRRDNIHLIAPASYPEFVWLMDRSKLILTDSGGVQEEAPSLKKPILVMRDSTERPEALDAGAIELVGTSVERIVDSVTMLLTNEDEYARRQVDVNPYGDGRAAGRIADLLLRN